MRYSLQTWSAQEGLKFKAQVLFEIKSGPQSEFWFQFHMSVMIHLSSGQLKVHTKLLIVERARFADRHCSKTRLLF